MNVDPAGMVSAVAGDLMNAMPTPRAGDDDAALRDACRQFEAVFMGYVLQSMRASVPKDGLIPRGNAEQVFQEMLDQELAGEATQGQSLGLASAMYDQLQRQTESAVTRQAQEAPRGLDRRG